MSDIRFSDIAWGATFQLAIIRLVSASLVVILFSVVSDPASFTGAILGAPAFLGTLVLLALVGSYLAKSTGVELFGFLGLPAFIVVIAGDPPLWVLSKAKPGLLPVDRFGFFNKIVLFVMK